LKGARLSVMEQTWSINDGKELQPHGRALQSSESYAVQMGKTVFRNGTRNCTNAIKFYLLDEERS
jgi:hypothetical protein